MRQILGLHLFLLLFGWASESKAQFVYDGTPVNFGQWSTIWDTTVTPNYNPIILPGATIYNNNTSEWRWNNTPDPLTKDEAPWYIPNEEASLIRDLSFALEVEVTKDTLEAQRTRIANRDIAGSAAAAQANAVQRANHTGTQAISTVTGLEAALDAKLSAEVDGSVTNEIELPSQTGQNGKVLGTDGNSPSWVDPTGAAWSFNNAPGRTIQTVAAAGNGWQVSSTRPADVSYSVTIGTTVSLSGNSTGYVVLEIASTNSSTAANWTEIARVASGQSGTLVIGLTLNQTGGGCLAGSVPAGYYVRVRSVNTAGTPSYTMNSGQEVTK